VFFSSGGQNHISVILLYFVILQIARISSIYGHPIVNKLHVTLKNPNSIVASVKATVKKRQTREKAASEGGNASGMGWMVRQEKMGFFPL